MRKIISTVFLLFLMSAGFASAASAQVSINIRIGQPPAPRVVRVIPRSPGPGYVWVDGYWYPVNNRYVWHDGYWTRPPYAGARWVRPHYEAQHYYYGHWEGDHGPVEHDHRWDKKKDRDYDHDRGGGRGRGRGRGHGGGDD